MKDILHNQVRKEVSFLSYINNMDIYQLQQIVTLESIYNGLIVLLIMKVLWIFMITIRNVVFHFMKIILLTVNFLIRQKQKIKKG